MINFKLTAEQLEKLLNYLSTRPWAEVNNLIIEFSKLEKIELIDDNSKETLSKETYLPLDKI